MRRVVTAWLRTGLTAALAFSIYSTARADEPSGTLTVNGQTLDFSNLFITDPQTGMYAVAPTTANIGGKTFTFGVAGDPDPVLSFSLSATNTTAGPLPFAFDLSIPIQSVGAGSTLISSLGVTLTDGGHDGISVQPFPLAPYLSNFIQTATGDGNDLGVGTISTTSTGNGINIGTLTTGIPGRTFATSFYGLSTSPFGFSTLGIHLAFLLSGGGDNVGFTGSIEVLDVPEPGSIALFVGLGFSGAGFLARHRRKVAKAA